MQSHLKLADHGRLARSDACGMFQCPSVGKTEQAPFAKVLKSSWEWIFGFFLWWGSTRELRV